MSRSDYTGAIAVMENYLDGAIADIDAGSVENLYLAISCMEAIITLKPIMAIDYGDKLAEYKARQEAAE